MDETCDDPATQAFLQEILAHFEMCARHAVEAVLDMPTLAARQFRVASSMTDQSSLGCLVQCWNAQYSLTISVGINKTDLDTLIPGTPDEDMALDALGEVANVIAGGVLKIPGLIDHFGFMCISPPLFSNGEDASTKACSILGTLQTNSSRLLLGFAVAMNEKEMV